MEAAKLQRGLSMPVLILILALVGFFLMVAFKVVPVYVENRYIVAALNTLGEDAQQLPSMTTREIKSKLQRIYTVNNIRSEGSKQIEVDKQSDKVLVRVAYETRVPLFLNVDLVMSFENELDSSQPDRCCDPI